jgi:hypothetical protein
MSFTIRRFLPDFRKAAERSPARSAPVCYGVSWKLDGQQIPLRTRSLVGLIP